MQHARADVPGRFRRRLDGVGSRDALDDALADHRARDEREDPCQDEAPAGGAQRLSAAPAGDPHRRGEQRHAGERQHEREPAQGGGHVLHGRGGSARDDRDSARAGRDLRSQRAGQPEPLADFHDERAQVEVDGLARDRHDRRLALGDCDEAFGCELVRPLPRLLHARALERPVGDVLRDVAQAARRRSGERSQARRQRAGQLRAHVDVRVDLVDEVAGDGAAHRAVLQQRGARARPVVGVQQLAVGPHRDDRQHRDDRPQREQAAHGIAPPPREGARGRRCGRRVGGHGARWRAAATPLRDARRGRRGRRRRGRRSRRSTARAADTPGSSAGCRSRSGTRRRSRATSRTCCAPTRRRR